MDRRLWVMRGGALASLVAYNLVPRKVPLGGPAIDRLAFILHSKKNRKRRIKHGDGR